MNNMYSNDDSDDDDDDKFTQLVLIMSYLCLMIKKYDNKTDKKTHMLLVRKHYQIITLANSYDKILSSAFFFFFFSFFF
jgi:hypothetical protein